MDRRKFAPSITLILIFILTAIFFLKFFFTLVVHLPSSKLNQSVPLTHPVVPHLSQPSTKTDKAKLEKYFTVESVLLGVQNNMSLYFEDLSSHDVISFDPTRSWIPASTIKAYVVLEAFRQRRIGLINFDQVITIQPENVVPNELETDDYPRLREGTQATIQQLIGAMITQSDNTAYNTLLDVLDRRNISATLRNIGITETVVGEKLNLDADQFQKDLTVAGRQSNTTTAKDLATFFNLLYNKQIADSDEMLNFFKKQKINSMIPALLPTEVSIAHKTGDLAPIYHDGGVIYKSDNPFILTIFTNNNDQTVLSQLARVAYYQNSDVVGQAADLPKKQAYDYPTIYLALDSAKEVLGETNGPTAYTVLPGDTLWSIAEKFYGSGDRYIDIQNYNNLKNGSLSPGIKIVIPFISSNGNQGQLSPTITAADLGITKEDLTVGKQEATAFKEAFITPDSPLYGLKRLYELATVTVSFTPDQKYKAYNQLAKNRLAETKKLLSQGNVDASRVLLSESEQNLKTAASYAQKTTTNQDAHLVELQQTNDLHYALLSTQAKNFSDSSKEAYVNMVYDFYKKNSQEVTPVMKKSIITNPIEQQPIVGTIESVSQNTAVLKFDNGSKKEITLSETTQVRDYHGTTYQTVNTLTEGSKIAVLGQQSSSGQVISTFILNDLPKEVPDKEKGKILQIDPKQRIIEIQDSDGVKKEVQVNDSTIIKAKDTNVSLEGIKAGSTISVVGEQVNPSSASAQLSPLPTQISGIILPSANPTLPAKITITPTFILSQPIISNGVIRPSISPGGSKILPSQRIIPSPSVNQNSKLNPQPSSKPTSKPPIIIKANTITVTNNESGAKEKVQTRSQPLKSNSKSSQPSKPTSSQSTSHQTLRK